MLSAELEMRSHPLQTMDMIKFQIIATPQAYEFSYRLGDKGSWMKVGSVDTIEFSGYDFTGTMFGVFASARREEVGTEITFEGFQIG